MYIIMYITTKIPGILPYYVYYHIISWATYKSPHLQL